MKTVRTRNTNHLERKKKLEAKLIRDLEAKRQDEDPTPIRGWHRSDTNKTA